MRIGVPKEIKNHEYRVGLTPSAVGELVHYGHQVLVETGAGLAIDLEDGAYERMGATIASRDDTWAGADLIVKVKEPQPEECRRLRPGQILFTYLHLAPDLVQTRGLIASGAICIAYETVTAADGSLPLLSPMSEVAGRMSIQAGAHCLERAQGGRGVLLGGVPGVPAAKVVILGGGVVGTNAARMAMGMEAQVTVIDRSLNRLKELDLAFGAKLHTLFSTRDAIDHEVRQADLVIGGVLLPGAAAPKLVSTELIKSMKRGAVVVDVAIDQGGCMETSRPTTHAEPTYIVDDVVHYCVANMPGAVARTSTFALNNATLPFVLALANKGYRRALTSDPHLMAGLNVANGKVTYRAVAEAHNLPFVRPEEALG